MRLWIQNKTVSESSLISLEARLEFELMFTKGKNTTLVEKLDELKNEYLSHFVSKSTRERKMYDILMPSKEGSMFI